MDIHSIRFTPEDIKYIIIQNARELDEVIEELKRIKGQYSKRQIDRVVSRIITKEQINEDF